MTACFFFLLRFLFLFLPGTNVFFIRVFYPVFFMVVGFLCFLFFMGVMGNLSLV